eukprot:SAG11_NODE_8370_length_1024_cov_0.801081_1_plen_120_part_00
MPCAPKLKQYTSLSADIFLPYAADIGVMHNFEPRPSTEPAVLGPHLAEFSGREFAMCGAVQVLACRLGTLVAAAWGAAALVAHHRGGGDRDLCGGRQLHQVGVLSNRPAGPPGAHRLGV